LAADRFVLRQIFAKVYGNGVWEAGDRDGAVSVFEGPSSWAIRAKLIEHLQVVDLAGVQPITRNPIGFAIAQGEVDR
jgi:hypothetical protein